MNNNLTFISTSEGNVAESYSYCTTEFSVRHVYEHPDRGEELQIGICITEIKKKSGRAYTTLGYLQLSPENIEKLKEILDGRILNKEERIVIKR